MKLVEVQDKRTVRDFLEMPVSIYKGDENYIRPLDKDIEEVFNPQENKFFRHGEAVRWVLYNDVGKPIGRVAAFINRRGLKKELPVGGMGFFECVDDQQAANTLFERCRQWLEEREMNGMDGPINFGEREAWWGLMVEGFHPPTYRMNYNPPYYQRLFEEYGFQVYFRQFVYSYMVDQPVPEKFRERAQAIRQDPRYEFRHINKKQLGRYAEDFLEVYNSAWSGHAGFKPMRKQQALAMLKSIKPIMEEELIWFGYYDNKPIAFFIMLPEVNQIFRHMDGKFGLWEKAKFLYYRWRGECTKMFGVVFGVVPEQQKKGVESAIIRASEDFVRPLNRYEELEMIWIGDFNPKMVNMVEGLGAKKKKIYHTYRKLFDPEIPFKRHPIL